MDKVDSGISQGLLTTIRGHTRTLRHTLIELRSVADKTRKRNWQLYNEALRLKNFTEEEKEAFNNMWNYRSIDGYPFSRSKFFFYREMENVRLITENIRLSIPAVPLERVERIPVFQKENELVITRDLGRRIVMSPCYHSLHSRTIFPKVGWGFLVDQQGRLALFLHGEEKGKFSIDGLWIIQPPDKSEFYIVASRFDRIVILDTDNFIGIETCSVTTPIRNQTFNSIGKKFFGLERLFQLMYAFCGEEKTFPVFDSRNMKHFGDAVLEKNNLPFQ